MFTSRQSLHRTLNWIALILLASAGAARAKDRSADPSAVFFTDPSVRVMSITITDTAYNGLQRQPRTYVSGTFSDGQTVLTNVGVHLKGMGSFRAIDSTPSFSIKFDRFTSKQSYHGLTKLMLNNSVQDTSLMAELLGTQLFRDAGVPAARVTYARVLLNGRDLGLHLAIEGMNKPFLKRHFKKTDGNLYEGYLADVNRILDQDAGPRTNQADVQALFRATLPADPAERFRQLSRMLDVERFASFAAMEVLLAHWDGYCIHTNNYRLYHDPASDRMVFIAHGLDGVFRRPNISIQPPLKSVVSRALFTTPEGKLLYDQHLRTLFTNVFRVEIITNRLNAALGRLRASGLKPDELAQLESRVSTMRHRVAERVARVAEQLAGVGPRGLEFDAAGVAKLTGWREEPDIGTPQIDRPVIDAKTTLHIDAMGTECRASWRLWTYLKPGHYVFEGMVRATGLQNGGAGLRISGDTRNRRIGGGDAPWQKLDHPFTIQEGEGDVEFVCELRTYQGGGQVWFDEPSLIVKRLQ